MTTDAFVHHGGSAGAPARPHAGHPRHGFARHFFEMFAAMVLGMIVLGGPEDAAAGLVGVEGINDHGSLLGALFMTINMTLPMLAWMRYRGHEMARIAEMGAAMFLPGATLVLLACLTLVSSEGLCGWINIAGLAAMLGVMLLRKGEYSATARPVS